MPMESWRARNCARRKRTSLHAKSVRHDSRKNARSRPSYMRRRPRRGPLPMFAPGCSRCWPRKPRAAKAPWRPSLPRLAASSVAAGLALAFVAARGFGLYPRPDVTVVYRPGGVPEFDIAAAYLDKFNQGWAPNVPSNSYGAVSYAYVCAHMPGFIWNFNGSGLTLMGGRLDKLPDGRPVTFTYYKGEHRSLLCTRYKVTDLDAPPGAVRDLGGHLFYRYHGYSICWSYSPIGDFVCVLITRQPVEQLLETV